MSANRDYFIILDDSSVSHLMYQILLKKYSNSVHKVSFVREEQLIDQINKIKLEDSIALVIDRNLLKMNAFELLEKMELHLKFDLTKWSINIISALFAPEDQLLADKLPYQINFIQKPLNKEQIKTIEHID